MDVSSHTYTQFALINKGPFILKEAFPYYHTTLDILPTEVTALSCSSCSSPPFLHSSLPSTQNHHLPVEVTKRIQALTFPLETAVALRGGAPAQLKDSPMRVRASTASPACGLTAVLLSGVPDRVSFACLSGALSVLPSFSDSKK